VDYMKAKKGDHSGEDCSKVASAFRRLADTCPPSRGAQQRGAVDLECGKKASGQHLEEAYGCSKPLRRPGESGLRELAGRNKSDAESLFKRSIEADPWSAPSLPHQHGADLPRTGSSASGSEKKSLNDAAVRNYGAFSPWMGTACRPTPAFASSTST